jgi:trehalose 6-phosphate synthase/phosphatase
MRWLARRKWDFILGIGDDWTDEDIFAALPEHAFSIKIGFKPSQARYNMDSVDEVRSLLKAFGDFYHKDASASDALF